jgi:hypothetical protein
VALPPFDPSLPGNRKILRRLAPIVGPVLVRMARERAETTGEE